MAQKTANILPSFVASWVHYFVLPPEKQFDVTLANGMFSENQSALAIEELKVRYLQSLYLVRRMHLVEAAGYHHLLIACIIRCFLRNNEQNIFYLQTDLLFSYYPPCLHSVGCFESPSGRLAAGACSKAI